MEAMTQDDHATTATVSSHTIELDETPSQEEEVYYINEHSKLVYL